MGVTIYLFISGTYIALSIYAALYIYITHSHQSLPSRSVQSKVPNSHLYIHSRANFIQDPINLPACLWSVGGNRSTRRKPTQAQGEHANSRQVVSWLGFEPPTLLLLGESANHYTTVPPHMFTLTVKKPFPTWRLNLFSSRSKEWPPYT